MTGIIPGAATPNAEAQALSLIAALSQPENVQKALQQIEAAKADAQKVIAEAKRQSDEAQRLTEQAQAATAKAMKEHDALLQAAQTQETQARLTRENLIADHQALAKSQSDFAAEMATARQSVDVGLQTAQKAKEDVEVREAAVSKREAALLEREKNVQLREAAAMQLQQDLNRKIAALRMALE